MNSYDEFGALLFKYKGKTDYMAQLLYLSKCVYTLGRAL